MGETGALPLGAGLAIVALMTGWWLLLPVIGVVFVAEGLSDVDPDRLLPADRAGASSGWRRCTTTSSCSAGQRRRW